MPIKIKELAFICHPVTDIDRARGFYEKLLGLKADLNVEVQPGVWWIEYDVSGVALAVSNAFPATGASAVSLALEVSDFEGSQAAVQAAGFPLAVEPQDYPTCRMFGILSPDGHSVLFHQRKA